MRSPLNNSLSFSLLLSAVTILTVKPKQEKETELTIRYASLSALFPGYNRQRQTPSDVSVICCHAFLCYALLAPGRLATSFMTVVLHGSTSLSLYLENPIFVTVTFFKSFLK